MMICGSTQTRLAQVSNFAEVKTNLSPMHVHVHYIWVKISTFYKDGSTNLRDFEYK